jgi:hypothetical protein
MGHLRPSTLSFSSPRVGQAGPSPFPQPEPSRARPPSSFSLTDRGPRVSALSSPPPSSSLGATARDPRRAPLLGPARQWDRHHPTKSRPNHLHPNPSSCVAKDLQRRRPFSSTAPPPLRHRGHAVSPCHGPRELAHQHRLTTPELLSPSPATLARSSARIIPRSTATGKTTATEISCRR